MNWTFTHVAIKVRILSNEKKTAEFIIVMRGPCAESQRNKKEERWHLRKNSYNLEQERAQKWEHNFSRNFPYNKFTKNARE